MTKVKIGRVAFREEGPMWNAYYARPDTMDGAILLGSLAMSIARASQEAETAFINAIHAGVTAQIREALDAEAEWDERAVRVTIMEDEA